MRKRKIKGQFKIFRIYKASDGKPCKRDWVAKVVLLTQMLLTFSGRCNRYFWEIQLKILMFPNFNMLFQPVPSKFFKSELFSRLPQVDHVTTVVKETEREGRGGKRTDYYPTEFSIVLRVMKFFLLFQAILKPTKLNLRWLLLFLKLISRKRKP